MIDIEYGENPRIFEYSCTCEYCYDTTVFEIPEVKEDEAPEVFTSRLDQEFQNRGWHYSRILNQRHDFCCDTCRNNYIKENT